MKEFGTYNDENMRRFRYPVDTDQFADIRKDGKVYVDKTDMVYDLVDRYKYVFLARPRRFGKSLLCNTFKAYPYEADGRRVTKCGVSISSEARNITHWRVVDEEGNIIDEQKFNP